MQDNQPQSKTVYFIRHGQSVDNAAPVFQGRNSPLSDKGRRQAGLMAERVSKLSFDALIASPLPRALETAEAISKASGKTIETSEYFVERIKPTKVDGKPWTDEAALALYREWDESMYATGLRAEDGENYDDIVARADKALAFLLARPEQSIVVVSHGHFLRTIVARVLLGQDLTGDSLKRIQRVASIENTGITVLRYKDAFEEDAAWRLWTMNDHAHFAE